MAKKFKKTVVAFDMWGQLCHTVFDDKSELEPLVWLSLMYEKGWLMPVQAIIIESDSQIQTMSKEDLLRVLDPELYGESIVSRNSGFLKDEYSLQKWVKRIKDG